MMHDKSNYVLKTCECGKCQDCALRLCSEELSRLPDVIRFKVHEYIGAALINKNALKKLKL